MTSNFLQQEIVQFDEVTKALLDEAWEAVQRGETLTDKPRQNLMRKTANGKLAKSRTISSHCGNWCQ